MFLILNVRHYQTFDNLSFQLSVISYQLSVISYQLLVPLAKARGLTSGIFSFFIPLKGEAHTHNFSVKIGIIYTKSLIILKNVT